MHHQPSAEQLQERRRLGALRHAHLRAALRVQLHRHQRGGALLVQRRRAALPREVGAAVAACGSEDKVSAGFRWMKDADLRGLCDFDFEID